MIVRLNVVLTEPESSEVLLKSRNWRKARLLRLKRVLEKIKDE